MKGQGKTMAKTEMLGKKFGRLTVINESDKRSGKRRKLMYDCICDCGNLHTVCGESLRNGGIQSCGCLYRETRTGNKNYNIYDLESYTYGVGYCENGTYFFFDKEDYFKIKDYSWWYDGRYVVAHSLKNDEYTTKIVRMHRVVMNIRDREDISVDHKNLVRYDCRKSNLRLATDKENARNKTEYFCTYENPIGVHKIHDSRYDVFILKKLRGSRKTLNEAIKYRQELEEKIYGDFRYNPNIQRIIELDQENEYNSLLLCSNE